MKVAKLLIILVLNIIIASCGSNKKTVSTNPKTDSEKRSETSEVSVTIENKQENKNESIVVRPNQTTKDYVTTFSEVAMNKMREHNIPASITLAQGILESGSGNSTLTLKSNNHFGIKCHKEWNGPKVYHDDDEKGECFRVYEKPEQSFEDHSMFLVSRTRYASLFNLKSGDYIGWAYGLKDAGYATDKKYPQKLIAYIEKYELYKYDELVLGKPAELSIIENSINLDKQLEGEYIVKKGDGLYSIAKSNNITINELKELNDLSNDDISVGQKLKIKKDVLIRKTDLKEKSQVISNQSLNNNELPPFHVVEKSEGLYTISKKYDIRIEDLKEINNLKSDELKLGQKLFLHKSVVSEPLKAIHLVKKDTIDLSKTIYHTVAKGEGLYAISKKYNKTIEEIKFLNNLLTDEIKEGEILIIHREQKTPVAEQPETVVIPPIEYYRVKVDVPYEHIVQNNETLFQIAYKYDLEVPFLRKLNKLTTDVVKQGQIIKLKVKTLNTTVSSSTNIKTHTVLKGDTLFSISKLYNIAVEKLIEINEIQNNIISIGQVLKLE